MSHPPRPREVRVGGLILVIDPAEGKRAADRTIGDPPARRLECGTSQNSCSRAWCLARIGCGGRRHRLRIGKRQCHRLFQPDMFSGFQCCLGHRAVHAVGGGDRHHVHLRIGDSFLPMSGGAGKTELVRELLGAFRLWRRRGFRAGDAAPPKTAATLRQAIAWHLPMKPVPIKAMPSGRSGRVAVCTIENASDRSAERAFQLGHFLSACHHVLKLGGVDLAPRGGAECLATVQNRKPVTDRHRVTDIVGDEDDADTLLTHAVIVARTLAVWRTPSAEVGSSRMCTFARK